MASADPGQPQPAFFPGSIQPYVPGHVPPLDGIRGLSALVVVLAHSPKLGLPRIFPDDLSSYAVMVFFALSGLLMGHLYLYRRFDTAVGADYVAARVARIVPLYYGIVLVSWFIYNHVDASFFYAMTNAALVRHLLFFGSVSYFWSIGPEVQFYAVFLLFWWTVARSHAGDPRPLIVFLVAAGFIFVFQPAFPGITVFSKLHIFMAGVGLAVLHRRLDSTLRHGRLILGVQIALVVLSALLWLVPGAGAWLLTLEGRDLMLNVYYGDARRVMLGALIVFAFSFETGFANAVFANALARRLGAYSYSIYLLHGPALWALERGGVFAWSGPVLGFAIVLGVVYLIGWLSFTVIEMPSQRLLRRPLARWLHAMAPRPARGSTAP